MKQKDARNRLVFSSGSCFSSNQPQSKDTVTGNGITAGVEDMNFQNWHNLGILIWF